MQLSGQISRFDHATGTGLITGLDGRHYKFMRMDVKKDDRSRIALGANVAFSNSFQMDGDAALHAKWISFDLPELENESIFIGPPCWCFWRWPLSVEQQEFSAVDGQQ